MTQINTPAQRDILLTTPIAWDCECEHNYIHPVREHRCSRCGACVADRPDAHTIEIAAQRPDILLAALGNAIWREVVVGNLQRAMELDPTWRVPPEIAVALQVHKSDPPTFPALQLEKGKLYLRLFHGRKDKGESLDDWGFDGPLFGPLVNVHGTYTEHLKLQFERDDDAAAQGLDPDFPEIRWADDLLTFAGCYFGDFTVFVADEETP